MKQKPNQSTEDKIEIVTIEGIPIKEFNDIEVKCYFDNFNLIHKFMDKAELKGYNLGKSEGKQEVMDILESDSLDWGSYIKGKGAYWIMFDSRGFIEQIKAKLKKEKTA